MTTTGNVTIQRSASSATTTSISSASNPSIFGQTVTFTATETTNGVGPLPGNVDFFDQTTGTNLGSAPLQVIGGIDEAILSTSALVAQTHTIVTTYNAQGGFLASSDHLNQIVNQATPAVTVTDVGGSYSGTAYVATDTVTGVTGTAANTLESVAPVLTYWALDAHGDRDEELTSAPVDVGQYEADAFFPGSDDYLSASATTTFAINPAPTDGDS